MKTILICTIIVGVCAAETVAWTGIETKLLMNYDPNALPLQKNNITLGFSIISMDMREETQALRMHIWARMRWQDPRLTWKADEYPNVKNVKFPKKDIWHPDMSLYNIINGRDLDAFASTLIHVTNGSVIWVPPGDIEAACAMDMTYWPHDVHSCTAKFGSWVHSADQVDLIIQDNGINIEDLTWNHETNTSLRSEWKLDDIRMTRQEKYYDCCPDAYVSIALEVTLSRQAPAYRWLVKMPALALSLLTCFIFLFPPASGEKILLGSVGLILDLGFAFSVAKLIGHVPSHTPLLIKLLINQFLLTLTSLIISVMIIRMVRSSKDGGLPSYLKSFLERFSSCLCLEAYKKQANESSPSKQDDAVMTEMGTGRGLLDVDDNKSKWEWYFLGAFLDRICFCLYIFIFFIHAIYFSGVI